MDLANWALQISQKFTTGVKYQFHQVFLTRSEIRKFQSPFAVSPPFVIFNLSFHELLQLVICDKDLITYRLLTFPNMKYIPEVYQYVEHKVDLYLQINN